MPWTTIAFILACVGSFIGGIIVSILAILGGNNEKDGFLDDYDNNYLCANCSHGDCPSRDSKWEIDGKNKVASNTRKTIERKKRPAEYN